MDSGKGHRVLYGTGDTELKFPGNSSVSRKL